MAGNEVVSFKKVCCGIGTAVQAESEQEQRSMEKMCGVVSAQCVLDGSKLACEKNTALGLETEKEADGVCGGCRWC